MSYEEEDACVSYEEEDALSQNLESLPDNVLQCVANEVLMCY
jgi:hypothetical protein